MARRSAGHQVTSAQLFTDRAIHLRRRSVLRQSDCLQLGGSH